MTAVRDLATPQVVIAGDTVQELHRALMEPATAQARNAAQRQAALLAKYANALAVALSDAEVTA